MAEAQLQAEMQRREKMEELMMAEAKRASLQEGGSNGREMALEVARLAAKAKAFNLHEIQVPRDGNCQFHSVSQSLAEVPGREGMVLDHIALRKLAVAWLLAHRDFRLNEDDPDTTLSHYLDSDPSWEAYCARMGRQGQYGDHLTLIAMAECFSCCIMVVTSEAEGINYHTRPRDSTPQDTIYLAHYPIAQHYNRLTLAGEPSTADSSTSSPVSPASDATGVIKETVHLGSHLTTGFAYKIHCPNGELRRIRTEYNATQGQLKLGHEQLREKCAKICKLQTAELMLRWQDHDGDLITFDTDEELLDAVKCAAAAGRKVLRIFAEEATTVSKSAHSSSSVRSPGPASSTGEPAGSIEEGPPAEDSQGPAPAEEQEELPPQPQEAPDEAFLQSSDEWCLVDCDGEGEAQQE